MRLHKALLLVALLAVQPAGANTITVTSTADSGAGTLRAALASAANGDTINLAVTGAITLTNGELLVTKNVTIAGPGPTRLSVNGNLACRVFHIGSNAVATISGLTITNGLALSGPYPGWEGGGIYNDHATMTVSNCTLTGNSAPLGDGGGIHNDGSGGSASLRIVNSILSGNSAGDGGGIYNDGCCSGNATLQIVNSILSWNYPDGIYNEGMNGRANVQIVGSTVSHQGFIWNHYGNVEIVNSSLIANGILNDSFNGGSASLQIINSTLSGGSRIGSGATYSGRASVQIINSTLSGNSNSYGGGAIANEGQDGGTASVQIVNSTLGGNSAPLGSSIYNDALDGGSATVEIGSTILNAGRGGNTIFNFLGTVTSLGYNLSSDDGGGFLTTATDRINADPMLGPLQDNGGPTFTHAPVYGSPAIDQGKNFGGLLTDQRGAGFARTVDNPVVANANGGDSTDIGAVELQPILPREAVRGLIMTIEQSSLLRNRQRALIVSLNAALASIDRSNPIPAINQLQAFENKVRTQVAPSDPTLADQLIAEAQAIIAAMSGR